MILSLFTADEGDDCYRWHLNVYFILIVYATYMALFANFFYKTYLRKPIAAIDKEKRS